MRRSVYLLPLILAACVMSAEPPDTGNPRAHRPKAPVGQCGAEALQDLVGQHATVLDTMRFSQVVRVIRPGKAVTMDYAPKRLNILLDEGKIITRVSCG